MVALETQVVSQVVPQLVVAGEVDDGGGYSHHSAHEQIQVCHSRIWLLSLYRRRK